MTTDVPSPTAQTADRSGFSEPTGERGGKRPSQPTTRRRAGDGWSTRTMGGRSGGEAAVARHRRGAYFLVSGKSEPPAAGGARDQRATLLPGCRGGEGRGRRPPDHHDPGHPCSIPPPGVARLGVSADLAPTTGSPGDGPGTGRDGVLSGDPAGSPVKGARAATGLPQSCNVPSRRSEKNAPKFGRPPGTSLWALSLPPPPQPRQRLRSVQPGRIEGTPGPGGVARRGAGRRLKVVPWYWGSRPVAYHSRTRPPARKGQNRSSTPSSTRPDWYHEAGLLER